MTRYEPQQEEQQIACIKRDVRNYANGRVARRIAELGVIYTEGQIKDGDFLDQVQKHLAVARGTLNGG